MYYSLISFLAIILHFVINRDVIFGRGLKTESVSRDYKHYLNTVLAFYIVDMLWGLLSQSNLTALLYLDTAAYYITAAVTVVLWCKYVGSYLDLETLQSRFLFLLGVAFGLSTIIVVVINLFTPIIFDIDNSGRFNSEVLRIAAMMAQVFIFAAVAGMSFNVVSKANGRMRARYNTVAIYCAALVITVIIQYFFPLVPMYAMGLLIGSCVLHVFVQEDEKAEIRRSEVRNRNIIQALAQSFEQLNYISLDKGTYSATNYSYDITEEFPELKEIQNRGTVDEAISYAIKNLVSAAYKSEMSDFANLSDINERMAHNHMIFRQFKNYKDVWYEWSYIEVDRKEDGSLKHLIWGIRKIEDEKQAELRKQKIIEDNIAANNAKTVFLQNMSHEIRTPLNAMFGFSQLLGMPEGTWTETERELYNNYVMNSYHMMDMLIGDILDIADKEHGNYRINIRTVKVNEVCRNAINSAEFRRPTGVDMHFVTNLTEDHTIKTDGLRVQQVLVNYLTNACKHTQEGSIELSCSCTDIPGKLVFAVKDTGEGVPPEKAEEIFKRFTKLDQFTQGSGLGLNICQMVADKLGGQVYLDKTYRNGARFIFVLDDNQQ